jgi:hypothetical protein
MRGVEIAAVLIAILIMGAVSAKLRAESQIAPETWVAQKEGPSIVVLDAPPKGYSEWGLLVRVGDAEFAIPRVELRKLVVIHPEWKR